MSKPIIGHLPWWLTLRLQYGRNLPSHGSPSRLVGDIIYDGVPVDDTLSELENDHEAAVAHQAPVIDLLVLAAAIAARVTGGRRHRYECSPTAKTPQRAPTLLRSAWS